MRLPSRHPIAPASTRAATWMFCAAILCLFSGNLRADTISYRSGANTAPVTIEATVVGVENNDLVFTTQSGTKNRRPLDNVTLLKIKSEPRLSAAEQAYSEQKWEEAAKEYGRTLDSTDKAWIKTRATNRFVESAGKSQQFPLISRAFVELSKTNPAAAAKIKPTALPKNKPDQLTQAIADVDKAIASGLKPDQRETLTTYKATLLIAQGKQAEATKLLGGTPAPAASAGPSSVAPAATPAPGASAQQPSTPSAGAARSGVSADRALLLADQAFQQKKWPELVSTIEGARTSFTEPAQQARALWYLAEAKEATAGNDPTKLQDAAIAFMRLVAHFDEDRTANTLVPNALLRVAAIEERLNHPEEAMLIYQQLSKDSKYQGTAAAQTAAKKAAAAPKK